MPEIYHPAVHLVQYGDAMSGKSIAAATFPMPILVMAFDPPGKEAPYLRVGEPEELEDGSIWVRGIESGEWVDLIKIERYLDYDPEQPKAWAAFRKRVAGLYKEMDLWATVVLDSLTFAEIAARYDSQFRMNPSAKDPRRHYAYSTEELERLVMIRLGVLPCNVVIIAHIDEHVVFTDDGDQGVKAIKDEMHGIQVRNPSAPGRLKKHLPTGYNTLFRTYREPNKQGGLWQTDLGNGWNAGSQIVQLKSPVPAEYESLWREEYQL